MKQTELLLLNLAAILLAPALAFSQRGIPQTRINVPIGNRQLKILSGNTHPLAQSRFEAGLAPQNLTMERMMLVLTRTPEQQTALDHLLDSQNDPSSPNFHHWLTPEEFGAQFGASDQDLQTVTNWLNSYGFQVEPAARGKTIVEFSGTARQVADAFHTSIHKYQVDGANYWANADDPQIPAALTPVVAGVASLHNFPKRPHVRELGRVSASTNGSVNNPAPNYSSASGAHYLSPADFATIYNVNPAYQAGINGLGATIAVVARSNFNMADITSFRTMFGLSANPPQLVLNGVDPGDLGSGEETEVVLDTAWAGAVAPGATVKVVISRSTNTSDGVDLSEAYIINNNLADIMTESFGACEYRRTSASAQMSASLAAQAAAQGITYLVSTGDSGASGCSSGSATTASGPVSVNFLASNPYVVAVGGTLLNESGGTYWNSTNAAGTRSSALSHIPESAWNESCSIAQCGASGASLWATGGGASIFFAKPSWQAGLTGIPADGARDIPDVSLTAAGHDPYLICLRGSCSGAAASFIGVSGTSASAPSFAGIMALIFQKAGKRQGQANVTLYRLAANQSMNVCNGSVAGSLVSTCVFNDITVGNNAVPGQANYGTLDAQYQTGTGYDLATGLGSVNVANLLTAWTNNTALGSPATTLSATNLDFPSVNLGVSSTQTVGLSNTGTVSLAVSSIAITSDAASVFGQSNNCPNVLVPGASCSVKVTFLPRSVTNFAAYLTIVDSAAGSPHNVSLSGSGVGSLSLALSSSAVDFASQKLQSRSQTQVIQIANSTSQPITITGISLAGVNPADFSVANNCTALSVGQSCSIFVVLTPQLLGTRSASIIVASASLASPQSINLSGTGILAGAFEIVNGVSGKVLDLSPGASGNGAMLAQNSLNGQTQQQWIFYPVDATGFYYVVNASTGKCLDDPGGSSLNGMLMQQWDYLGGSNQQWQLAAVDDVHYAIVNRASGRALDLPGGSYVAGTLIQQWDRNGSQQQAWALIPAVTYGFTNGASGLMLDATNSSTANGTVVQQNAANGGAQQQWAFIPNSAGFYTVLNRFSGRVLDVAGAAASNGAAIQEFDFLNGSNQQWSFVLIDNARYRIVSRGTGKVLDVPGGSLTSGMSIQQWSYLGGTNQMWQITPVVLYEIVNRASGLLLEVPGGSTQDGVLIQQALRTNSQRQHWQFLAGGGGYFAMLNDLTGKALDVTAASSDNGALIQQFTYGGSSNQQWQSVSVSGDFSALISRSSAKGLDVISGSTAPGAMIQQFTYLGGTNQQWSLIPINQ